MKRKVLHRAFFNRSTPTVSRGLLGKFVVRRHRGKEIARMITEVEVYDGFRDRASHASRGRTVRNTPMFGPAGYWYVYFTYGMYWMLNIVTRSKGYPAAVLIRGIEGARGPARLTKLLKIDKRFNGKIAAKATGLWIEDRGYVCRNGWIYPPCLLRRSSRFGCEGRAHKASEDDFQHPLKIKKGPRVGVSYAGPYWARRHWRFWIEGEQFP